MGFIDELKSIFLGNGEKGSKNNYLRNIIILGMIGTLLLLTGNVFLSNNNPPRAVPQSDNDVNQDQVVYSDYENELARKLEEIISLIDGVGKVRAQVYVKNSIEYEYEYNQNTTNKITSENDQNGGERRIEEDTIESDMVIIKDSSGNEKPVVRRKKIPEITGILIVAQGAENSHLKYRISRAVSSFLDLPVHRISVLPYEGR